MDGFSAIWRDLTKEPVWKYEELPPFLVSQLTKLDLLEASDSELWRAIWFWSRRPKLMFHGSGWVMIVALCVLIPLSIAPFVSAGSVIVLSLKREQWPPRSY
jgi:hypothetical protein